MLTVPGARLMEWDKEADEPYLPVPRFPDLRLTPWREVDAEALLKLYNEPSIAKWSFRRSFPFLSENLEWMRQNMFIPANQTVSDILRPLFHSPPSSEPLPPPPGPVPIYPFLVIRHQPSGRMIGDFHLDHLPSPEKQAAAFEEQVPQAVPASEQTWILSYNLDPEWIGMGIGGAVLDSVLEGWVKWVGIGTILAAAETANVGSSGLVKSRGFVKVKVYMQEWPESKGGGKREVANWDLKMADYKTRLAQAPG